MILKPQNLKIFGNNISIGDYATLITAPDKRIDLSTWETDKINGEIQLGKYTLISPGTSIRSAKKITIGESTMIASDVTITDSDWHGIYDRTDYVATPKEVIIDEFIGQSIPLLFLVDFDLYEASEDQLKSLNTVATSLENALDALEKDTAFLTQGGVFTEDQIKGYIELKREEVSRLNNSTHPVEYDMYYSV